MERLRGFWRGSVLNKIILSAAGVVGLFCICVCGLTALGRNARPTTTASQSQPTTVQVQATEAPAATQARGERRGP